MDLNDHVESLRVSSTLANNTKSFGKQNLLDPNSESCWASESTSPQWISVAFSCPVVATTMSIVFQGGFSGREMVVCARLEATGTAHPIARFEPNDTGQTQSFEILHHVSCTHLKIRFDSSFDPFGRIVVYHLMLFGKVASLHCLLTMKSNLVQCVYIDPNDHRKTEFYVFCSAEMMDQWKKDKSIPVVSVVETPEIYSGATRPSKQSLANAFGEKSDEEIIRLILEHGHIRNYMPKQQ